MQGRANGPMESVLQVEGTPPLHHMREQVAKEGGVFGQQGLQIQLRLGGDQVSQSHLAWRDGGPILGRHVSMVRVGAFVANSFEDHPFRLGTPRNYGNRDPPRHGSVLPNGYSPRAPSGAGWMLCGKTAIMGA